ncbi:TPA: carbamoyltransferase [Methanocaldococcus jannaschii]|uniref:Uncharacterized protein MJ1058 n=2 Tax=Methanocaldococcus jannaschii TaxID=2190 RepID=Y1058_METJA|nr:carbamoyltransferase [Methanocaldococcus jannaschii]Q58458.1 RecName: Full=Uncharacterized protein MJ1058 [Methanocaldococcus jannaschii DSM 2661]AAB99062.1 nodulation protein [Methanocaldococcus jannaschii DSM 2661]HII59463.1 carbamoyltransferase [Methanocaldococcus jannaschii]
MVKILGVKYFLHDSGVFYIDTKNKEIFGILTERVTRIKHDGGTVIPILNEYPKLKNIDYVAYPFEQTNLDFILFKHIDDYIKRTYKPKYIKEYAKYKKELSQNKTKFVLNNIYRPFIWEILAVYGLRKLLFKRFNNIYNKLGNLAIKRELKKIFRKDVSLYEHHLCHAASAYYFSPFFPKETLVFTLDGIGDWKYHSLWLFKEYDYRLVSYSSFDIICYDDVEGIFKGASIGHIYSLFTEILGFTPNSDEGKTEALAAYGKPNGELYNLLKKGYKINKEKLRWEHDINILKKLHNKQYLQKWKEKIGDENFAATIQRWLEDTVVEYLNIVYEKFKIQRLAMAGGVVANVIMNLNIFERTPFEELYIFPAMGDDGVAAGAAILKAVELGEDISWLKDLEMPYWGPNYSREDVEKELKKDKWKDKITYEYIGEKWPEIAAEMIAKGNIIAVYQGKMEFGPRALGNRSILADPRDPKTRDKINSTVKRRPWFQPFCPSVLEEERERLFEKSYKHKHMAIAFRMKKEFWDKLPSAMHIDGTARPQFVEEKDNPNYYRLLKKFKEITGYGIVINTSFNLHGRTIVRTPEDAITDFIDCNIDAMFIEGYLVKRKI